MANVDNGHVQYRDVDWNYKLEDQNVVRQKNLFRVDVSLQRRIFWDACTHSGYKVEYFEPIEEHRDLYQDPTVESWKASVIVPCILDEHPKVKVLKEFGWFSEGDSELQAQLIYVPMYSNWETKEIFHVKDQSIFRMTYFGQNYPSDFRLTDKRMDSVYGNYWILKVSPEHMDNFYYVTDHGSHYLKRKKDDETVKCEHKENPEQQRDMRIYQNEDLEKYLFGKKGEGITDSTPLGKEITWDSADTYSQLIMRDDD
jgi:hypothetical protein